MQVFTRLQKLQLCTSHKAILKTLDDASDGHDEKVFNWKEDLEEKAAFSEETQVCVTVLNILCVYFVYINVVFCRMWVYPFLSVMILSRI